MLQPIIDTMLLPSLENMLQLSSANLPEGLFRIHVTHAYLIPVFLAIDNCDDSPCLNNGTCNHLQDGFRCDCAQGFNGLTCQGDSVLISFQLRKVK